MIFNAVRIYWIAPGYNIGTFYFKKDWNCSIVLRNHVTTDTRFDCLCFKVVEVADLESLEKRLARTFFRRVIYKHVAQEYQKEKISSYSSPESGEPLIVHLLIQCIKDYEIPRPQV